MNVTAAIYLRGDSLEPPSITRLTGVDPTIAHRKGEVVTSSTGRQTLQRTGVWIWRSDPFEVEDALSVAVTVLRGKFSKELALLEGVDEAWIDFLVLTHTDEQKSELTFGLSPSDCVSLGALGIPVYFTLGLVDQQAPDY